MRILLLSFLISGCATPDYSFLFGPSKEQRELEFQQRVRDAELRKIKDEEELKQAEIDAQKEKELAKIKANLLKPGTPIGTFKSVFGESNDTALINGQLFLGYDDPEKPMIYVFKDGKLNSYFVNSDLVKERLQQARFNKAQQLENERQEKDLANQNEMQRKAMWQQYLNSNRPVNTSCSKDYFGNVNCRTKQGF